MSPTIFRRAGFRFYFFSREETRLHVHVVHAGRGAKFWLEPAIGLAQNSGLDERELRTVERLVREHQEEIRRAWRYHFGR